MGPPAEKGYRFPFFWRQRSDKILANNLLFIGKLQKIVITIPQKIRVPRKFSEDRLQKIEVELDNRFNHILADIDMHYAKVFD